MILFQDVTKKYENDVTALDRVSFEIQDGEFVFIIGTSGAGKSTLVKLLLKEIDPSSGKIFLDEEEITRISRRRIPGIRKKIGVVFQDFRLLEDRNVYDNIGYVLDLQGLSSANKKKTIGEVLEMVGLEERRNFFPNQLSGGEQQRVSIARAMVNRPRYLIADEPTGNLDPTTSKNIMEAFEEIHRNGTTVIVSTHAKEIVDLMKRRVIHIDGGRIIRDEVQGTYDETD